ncbi:hypothetical protein D3C81_134700 [compost metagenome]|uniref:Pyrophosphatase n=1 Tax=Paenibacillus stellifer TaxID=169760 RepID=A0A089NB06_9BACL|nr:hypothetical protein [Paenibacillus stellifer]AIQ66039.1 hypothetical protein PSTEL_25910 [Paenibacillus stellifer]
MELQDAAEQVSRVTRSYCSKIDVEPSNEWFLLKIQEELGELVQCYLELNHKSRARGKTETELRDNFEAELADVLGLVLSMGKHNDMDMDQAIYNKWLKWLND